MSAAAGAEPTLHATYHSHQCTSQPSPTQTHTFTTAPLPSHPALLPDGNADVGAKTAFLSALRTRATEMQGVVNGFLTGKMEDEKRREGGDAGRGGDKGEEEREEEMYGEEDVGLEG